MTNRTLSLALSALLAGGLLLLCRDGQAQTSLYAPPPEPEPDSKPPPKQAFLGFYVDPLNILLGTVGGEVSLAPMKQLAFNLGVQYRSDDVGNDPISRNTLKLEQLGIRGGLQIFPSTARSLAGFYLYPRLTYVRGTVPSSTTFEATKTSGVELAGMAGYQWRFESGISIRLGGGLRFESVEVELTPRPEYAPLLRGPTRVNDSQTRPVIEFAVGFAF